MTKRIKKLEKDGASWKNKWENANKALIDMAEEVRFFNSFLLINLIENKIFWGDLTTFQIKLHQINFLLNIRWHTRPS
jgi:hypothetical protein